MKKITAGLLAAVCILALVSCSAVKPTDSRVVLTLDGEKLYYDCFRYVVLNSRADLDLGTRITGRIIPMPQRPSAKT